MVFECPTLNKAPREQTVFRVAIYQVESTSITISRAVIQIRSCSSNGEKICELAKSARAEKIKNESSPSRARGKTTI